MTSLPHDLAGRILDGSPDAVLICDRTGTVRYWNIAAERVFDFRAAEAVAASMDLIIPERLRARHWAGWETAMKTGATRYAEGQLLAVPARHKDGRQISIEFSIERVLTRTRLPSCHSPFTPWPEVIENLSKKRIVSRRRFGLMRGSHAITSRSPEFGKARPTSWFSIAAPAGALPLTEQGRRQAIHEQQRRVVSVGTRLPFHFDTLSFQVVKPDPCLTTRRLDH